MARVGWTKRAKDECKGWYQTLCFCTVDNVRAYASGWPTWLCTFFVSRSLRSEELSAALRWLFTLSFLCFRFLVNFWSS